MKDFDEAKDRLRGRPDLDSRVLWYLIGYPHEMFRQLFIDRVNQLIPKEATMEIELKEVQSSNITHIGYDAATKTLIVKFITSLTNKGSAKWSYAEVPPEKHEELMAAESKGKYFHTHIRNKHKATRIEEKVEEPVADAEYARAAAGIEG